MPYELVVVNVYGDTALQWVNPPNWKEKYEEYLAGSGDGYGSGSGK